jgi:hypothetical protein
MNRVIRAAGAHMDARGRSKDTFRVSSGLVKRFKRVSWFEDTRNQRILHGKL